MFRHVVLIKCKSEANKAQREAAVSGIRSLPYKIPQIRRFSVGENAEIDKDTFDLVVIADFDNAAGYVAYRDHPDHRTLLENTIRPIVSSRAAIQYEVP